MGNQQVTETNIAWLAGIVDGEGTFAISKNNGTRNPEWNARKVELSISGTDERLILRCVGILESLQVRPYLVCVKSKKKNRQDAWRVAVSKMGDLCTISKMLLPFLTCKAGQALAMYQYTESRITRTLNLDKKRLDGKRGRLTRHQITPEEFALGERLLAFNDPRSGTSTTAREGAKRILAERKIQSDLRRKSKKSAETADSGVVTGSR
jgi:hypothetical protein